MIRELLATIFFFLILSSVDCLKNSISPHNLRPSLDISYQRVTDKCFGCCKNIVASLFVMCSSIFPAHALEVNHIGSIATSGFIFKDSLEVLSFKDVKLPQITIYVADFQKPITEKISTNSLFDDPSTTSITCALTSPVPSESLSRLATDDDGEEIFEESRNLFFKQIHVRRLYDKKTNTVVYVSYATRLNTKGDSNKSRFKSSLCAVNLNSK